MGKVIGFPGSKKPASKKAGKKPAPAGQGKKPAGKTVQSTLCKNGHHKWQVDGDSRFDVKQGKLVTVKRCQRCGKTRVVAI